MSETKIKIAINGFGRIGRAAFKIAMEKTELEVVAINDLTNPVVLAHLLKYDTTYGIYPREVKVNIDGKDINLDDFRGDSEFYQNIGEKNTLVVDDDIKCHMFAEKDPTQLPWKDLGVDVVLECTGFFTKDDAAKAHVQAGAKKVVVSAPTKGGTAGTFLIGGNHDKYDGNELVSNASCTTNCISPVMSVMEKNFGILKSAMTTIHAVTTTQNLLDVAPGPRKPDMRRARAATWNMIPTSTGAAKATAEVIPELDGIFDGIAIRVPVITGSITDVTMVVEKKTSVEEVNQAFVAAMKDPFYKGVLKATYEPLVSSDIIGSTYSSIVDLGLTKVIDGDLVKILAWYDNEWGYSNRLVEMAMLTGK